MDKKEVYGLGTKSLAKDNLLTLAFNLNYNSICFYGDESCPFGEDEYETFFENEDFGKSYGPKYYDNGEFSILSRKGIKKERSLTMEEFYTVTDKLEGKQIKNFYDEIIRLLE